MTFPMKHVLPIQGIKAPKLKLVKKGDGSASTTQHLCDAEISALVGVSHPKETTTSFTEMVTSEKSLEHRQAIEDVDQFRVGLINATELKKRHSKTYKNWDDMKQRCNGNPEKGIPPIDRHPSFDSFSDFLVLSGPRPYPTWSVDRIDPEGPYSPDNCRWASPRAQSRNRTNTVFLTYQGVTRPLVEWAEIIGKDPNTLRSRKRAGWSDEEIIEGVRKTKYAKPLIHPTLSTRNPFDYTPWPFSMRERFEKDFQREGWAGEHRLHFMKRYAQEWLKFIASEIEDVSWPDDYDPGIEEEGKAIRLEMAYKRWQVIFLDATEKLAHPNLSILYLRRNLPTWVENKLQEYAS